VAEELWRASRGSGAQPPSFENISHFPTCVGEGDLIYYCAMGQQLRQRAKRNRRKAYAKRVNARLLAAKKAK